MRLGSMLAVIGLFGVILHSESQARMRVLAPSSKWQMNYDRDSCTLSRAFGKDDDYVVVQFIRYQPSAGFDLNLIGKPFRAPSSPERLRIKFGEVGSAVTSSAIVGVNGIGSARRPMLFAWGRLDNLDEDKIDFDKLDAAEAFAMSAIDPTVEAAVTAVSIEGNGSTVTLQLGSMAPPMREMRKCTTELVQSWGLRPEEQERLLSRPIPKQNPARWLSTDDYPSGSLSRGEQAIIRFRLMVGADGQVTTCSIQSSVGGPDFAEVSCALVKRRAHFNPARLPDMTPVPSYYLGRIRWMIP